MLILNWILLSANLLAALYGIATCIHKGRVELNYISLFSIGYIFYWVTPIMLMQTQLISYIEFPLKENWISIYHSIGTMRMNQFLVFSLIFFICFFCGSLIKFREHTVIDKSNASEKWDLRAINIILIGVGILLLYFVFQFRGALFTGYNKIDWAQTGQKGNLVGTSLIFMNLILLKNLMKQKYKKVLNLKHYFISIEMVFFLTVQVMILSLGTRIYFLISLIAIIMFASIFITKFKTKYVILGTLFLVILISCVGLFRYGFNLSEVNFLSPVNNILQETMLNSFSLIATINFNHWGIIRFPIYLMQDTLNGVLSHLPVHLPAHDPSKAGYPLYSPVGGTSLFYSLIINFGFIGSFIFAFAVSSLLNYLRNTKTLYTNAVYVCLSSTLIFTFFRDNFYISIIKVGIQDFVVFPAIVLLTIWCLYFVYHKFFDKNKLKSNQKRKIK